MIQKFFTHYIESYLGRSDHDPLLGDSTTVLTRLDSKRWIDAYAYTIDRSMGSNSSQLSVAILLPRNVHYLSVIFGVWKAGHYYIPLNMEWPEQYIKEILNHLQPDILVTDLNGCWPAKRIICTADVDIEEDIPTATIAAWKGRGIAPGLAYMIYTSGSTGAPKGVMISKAALLSYIQWVEVEFDKMSAVNSLVINGELSFDISVADIAFAISHNIAIHITRTSRDILSLIGTILEHNIESIYAVPTTLLYMCRIIKSRDRLSLPRVKFVFSGGEVLTPQLIMDIKSCFPNAAIYNMYGPTEVTINCMSVRVDDLLNDIVKSGEVPTGRIPKHIRWALLSEESNKISTDEGELILSGAQLMDGYHLEPMISSDAKIEIDGLVYYRTGDYFRKEGDLFFYRGRKDALVKIHGYRINTNDITAVIAQHGQILEALTIALEVEGSSELVVFYNMRNAENEKALVFDLRELCSDKLPSYMVPRYFINVDNFPRGLSGKVNTRKLQEFAHHRFRGGAIV